MFPIPLESGYGRDHARQTVTLRAFLIAPEPFAFLIAPRASRRMREYSLASPSFFRELTVVHGWQDDDIRNFVSTFKQDNAIRLKVIRLSVMGMGFVQSHLSHHAGAKPPLNADDLTAIGRTFPSLQILDLIGVTWCRSMVAPAAPPLEISRRCPSFVPAVHTVNLGALYIDTGATWALYEFLRTLPTLKTVRLGTF